MSQPEHGKDQAPIVFGAAPVAAAVAAFGFSLFAWVIYLENPYLLVIPLALGFAGIKMGMSLPDRGKMGWYAAGILAVGLVSAALATGIISWPLPTDFTASAPGTLVQQIIMFAVLYFFFRKLIPVQPPRMRHST